MIRTVAAIAAAAVLLAAPAFARDDAALKAAAGAYVRHPVVQQTIDGMWSGQTMRSALVAQMRASGRTLRDDQIDTLTRIVREELARLRPQFETLMENAVFETYALEGSRGAATQGEGWGGRPSIRRFAATQGEGSKKSLILSRPRRGRIEGRAYSG